MRTAPGLRSTLRAKRRGSLSVGTLVSDEKNQEIGGAEGRGSRKAVLCAGWSWTTISSTLASHLASPRNRMSAMVLRRPIASSSAHVLASLRRHSTSIGGQPAFAPTGSTSAETEVPYGDPSLASSAYLPSPAAPGRSPTHAASDAPQLTPRQRAVVESIIRVDQAGELGANWIYAGQHAVLSKRSDKDRKSVV